MKKIVTLALVALLFVFCLAGCGKSKFKCDVCQEEKNSKKHTTADGEITMCEDCYKEVGYAYQW